MLNYIYMKKKHKKLLKRVLVLFIFIAILFWGGYSMKGSIMPLFFRVQESDLVNEGVRIDDNDNDVDIEIITTDLKIPWEIVFLPDNSILMTERDGNLIHLSNGFEKEITDVSHVGEGGLLGITLHPNFSENNYLYLYMTTNTDNRLVRYIYKDYELHEDKIIIEDIPRARFHNGGRIAFGPDNYLYITTGDALDTQLAQDLNSLAGKILRVDEDGGVIDENPFGDHIYSYGHRNPQGLAWDSDGNLWSTEHGPTAQDELNLIKPGKNYGWPIVSGDEEDSDMESPARHSGYDYTWAPSGASYFNNSIFFAGLRGQAIYEAQIKDEKVEDFFVHFKEDFGRIRSIVLGPDEMFYIITNNTDGRGSPEEDDDKLIRINPSLFNK